MLLPPIGNVLPYCISSRHCSAVYGFIYDKPAHWLGLNIILISLLENKRTYIVGAGTKITRFLKIEFALRICQICKCSLQHCLKQSSNIREISEYPV